MAYTAPVIERIVIKGKVPCIRQAVLAWESMQLPGFIGVKATVNGEDATRFIAIDAIEEMTIADEELYKCSPSCFVPETRLKATIDR